MNRCKLLSVACLAALAAAVPVRANDKPLVGGSIAFQPIDGIRAPDRNVELTGKLRYVIRQDRKSTRLNSSHSGESRMPSSA